MSSHSAKLLTELKATRAKIEAAIGAIEAGINWQTPEERADFELDAKRQWLCEQLGLRDWISWDEIVQLFKDYKWRIDRINGIVNDILEEDET